MMRYKLFKDIGTFLTKGIYIFKLRIFVEKLSNFISFSEQFYFKFISYPELLGLDPE
jgi:hypothetical protein